MRVRTHVIGENQTCSSCGLAIPDIYKEKRKLPLVVGMKVGVIETKWTEHSAYLIGETDSNLACNALVPLV